MTSFYWENSPKNGDILCPNGDTGRNETKRGDLLVGR